ncbi:MULTISPECIES: hypothetical protein [Sphingobium]|uniref:hypothetical protein n=1 Tax=Sphingobium TaxID=165695 RepID=UPI00159C0C18|nr:hypothetical protein [Sphingobium sp. 15-1]
MSDSKRIEDYALVYFLSQAEQLGFAGGYIRVDEFRRSLEESFSNYFRDSDYDKVVSVRDMSASLFDSMLSASMIDTVSDEYAGDYFCLRAPKYSKFRADFLSSSSIYAMASKVGDRFYKDVLDNYIHNYLADEGAVQVGLSDEIAPASDRVVTFSDNQISELDQKATEVINAVSDQNQIADEPGLREIVLGQLKAGRELVRAGSFKLYVLEITLIETLRFLVKRYEREAIGGLAAALITALIKHIGIDA